MVATENNLIEMLRLKPQVLHISCHGIEKSVATQLDNSNNKYLLLENEFGEGTLVS